jgi:hypothetical protein
MTAKSAALTALAIAVLSAPASASAAAAISVDQQCYGENDAIAVSGSGYTPGTIVTLTIGGTTSSADADAAGAFATTVDAPVTTLKHPGAQETTLTTRDTTSGEETSTQINVAKTGVDGVPSASKPHKKITWNIAGFPSDKAIYGHWRFGGKTRADHRMGKPQGPCGVLHAKARQIEAGHVRFGVWTVQFDLSRHYNKHTRPAAIVTITVSPVFS